jgi:hypothetical protein
MQQLLDSMQALLTPGSQLASELLAVGCDAQAVYSSVDAALADLNAACDSIRGTITNSSGVGAGDGNSSAGRQSASSGGADSIPEAARPGPCWRPCYLLLQQPLLQDSQWTNRAEPCGVPQQHLLRLHDCPVLRK